MQRAWDKVLCFSAEIFSSIFTKVLLWEGNELKICFFEKFKLELNER